METVGNTKKAVISGGFRMVELRGIGIDVGILPFSAHFASSGTCMGTFSLGLNGSYAALPQGDAQLHYPPLLFVCGVRGPRVRRGSRTGAVSRLEAQTCRHHTRPERFARVR